MTTILAWLTADAEGGRAVHLAGDSRLTWPGTSQRWDGARKLFACTSSPDLFCYCGDTIFPIHLLSQIVDLVDRGVLYAPHALCERRNAAVVSALEAAHATHRHLPNACFDILHVARCGSGAEAKFRAWRIAYGGARRGWSTAPVLLDLQSPFAMGSGAARLLQALAGKTPVADGARNRFMFGTFCEHLAAGADPASGGAPQLAAIRRVGSARTLGVIHEGARFLHGLPSGSVHVGTLEWRDAAFAAIDGRSLQNKSLMRRRDRARTKSALRSPGPDPT